MRWWSDFLQLARNGIGSLVSPGSNPAAPDPEWLGTVRLHGHGGLTGREFASAGASIAAPPDLATIADVRDARERLEAFVERAATDVRSRHLGGSYWDLQAAGVDADDERFHLAAEMDRLDRVEGAAIVGWVVRNAALRIQRPIATIARADDAVTADALALARTLLDSAQRLDPTDGGFLFSLRPHRGTRWRSRGRFGHLWVYGD